MTKPSEKLVEFPQASARDVLTDVLRTGAQRMLATAIEAEVDEYLDARATTVDAAGQRGVVRNGRLPERTIQTPVGDVQVQQPRVRDRRPADERETFRSAILPPYLRKNPQLGGPVSLALSQGHQHRRLRRGAPGRCWGPRRAGYRRRPSRG